MSYRTYIDGVQLFGNNEYYPEWLEFLKSQNIDIDDEHCYEGDISDFMGALTVLETIVLKLNAEKEALVESCGGYIGKRKMYNLFDFTHIIKTINDHQRLNENGNRVFEYGVSLFDELHDLVESSYAFIPYMFYTICENKLECIDSFSTKDHFHCYKLKDGESIHVKAS